ncbi:hypothetical protein ABPG73_019866 [Tetrahymena malaccensis]
MFLYIIIFIFIKVQCYQFENKTQTLKPFYFNIHSDEKAQIIIPTSIFSQYRTVFNYNKIDGPSTLNQFCKFKYHNLKVEHFILQTINPSVDGQLISFFTFNKYVVAITDKFRIIQFSIEIQEPIYDPQNLNTTQNSSQPLYSLEQVQNKITRIFENVIPLNFQSGLQGETPLFGYSNENTVHLFYRKRSIYMKISSFNIYEIEDNSYQERNNIYRILSLSSNEILIASGKDGLDYYKITPQEKSIEKLSFFHKNIKVANENDIRDIIFLSKNSTNFIYALVDYTKTIYVCDQSFKILFSIKDVPPQVTRITSPSPSILLAIGVDQEQDSQIREYIIDLPNKNYSVNRQYKGDDDAWNEIFADKQISFVLGKYRSRIFFHGINRQFLPEYEIDSRNKDIMIDQNLYKNVILAFQMPVKEDLLLFAITPEEILSISITQTQNYLECLSSQDGEGSFQLQMFSTECDSLTEINQGYQICNNVLDVKFDITSVYIDSKNLTNIIIIAVFSFVLLVLIIALIVMKIIKRMKNKYQEVIEENRTLAQKYQELENQSSYMTKQQF